jgi:citrate lyase subunit beta/citryl-CoA lyase
MKIKPRRSMLFMPASNARALEKGRTLPADGLIFDLEDSVAPDQKESARSALVEALGARAYGSREIIVRVNGLDTPWGADDVAALAKSGADALLFPKIACAQDVLNATLAMEDADSPIRTRLWAMTETALGVLNAGEIAASAKRSRLSALVVGANDLVRETRIDPGPGRANLTPWLLQCALAARAHGLEAFDSVYNNFTDAAGFAAECAHGRALGFDGKTLIHPGQIEACNAAFAPRADEIAWARAVIAAFKAPESEGKGAIALQGAMIERLHLEGAMRIMAIADSLAKT